MNYFINLDKKIYLYIEKISDKLWAESILIKIVSIFFLAERRAVELARVDLPTPPFPVYIKIFFAI